MIPQDHKLENVLDFKIIDQAQPALTKKHNQNLKFICYTSFRTVGAMLSNEISKIHGAKIQKIF